MKTTLRILALVAISLLAINSLTAQKASYSTNGGMTIGFGMGASYQGSDVINSKGTGFDFWLGHHLYKKENAFLAADWRFHFVTGNNKAFDHRINTDDTYSNVRLNFYNYDLELGLTLNRLRERTRIIITGFAGAGITHGRVFTDLYDADNNLYDYSVIDPGKPASEIEADLKTLSDNDFETKIWSKGAILPTAGIFIGYQFTPGFSMGIEHKTNFSMSEVNNTFGIDIDNKIATGSRKDRNHYTSLGFKWSMGRRYGGSSQSNAYRTNTPIPNLPVVTDPVTVTKTDTSRSATTRTSTATTIGNITRMVTTAAAVVDAVTTRPPTQVPPPNTSTGTRVPPARTGTGTTQKRPAPIIQFINPPSTVTVETNQFLIRVQTTNVDTWNDVTVSIGGSVNTNFSFSPEGLVILNIGLIEGQNRIDVTGKNESGTQTGTTYITYRKPTVTTATTVTPPVTVVPPTTTVTPPVTVVPPTTTVTPPVTVVPPVTTTTETRPCPTPTVRMLDSSPSIITTSEQTYTFRTEVRNIVDRNQLKLTLNGTTITDFTLNGNAAQCATSLKSGINYFEITATNDCGSQSANASVVYAPAIVAETPCGPRINPGNSTWQFCLVTPGATYNRDNLEDKEFQYSGSASSLYILPIAGGGDAIVNGKPYKLKSGQFYLFTGNLTVTVSTKNPGSMGQWSVCIRADREPVYGNGNNRPASPCEPGTGR